MDCMFVSVFEYKGNNALYIDFVEMFLGFFDKVHSSSESDTILNMSQKDVHMEAFNSCI